MYPSKKIRYLNLPGIPQDLVDRIPRDYDSYDHKVPGSTGNNYVWTDSHNSELDTWCKQNICECMYFAYQIINGDLPLHKDRGTKVKLIYLLDTGGPDVWTEFYADQQGTTLLQREKLEVNRWQIMQTEVYHRVVGVLPGQTRFSITGRIFD